MGAAPGNDATVSEVDCGLVAFVCSLEVLLGSSCAVCWCGKDGPVALVVRVKELVLRGFWLLQGRSMRCLWQGCWVGDVNRPNSIRFKVPLLMQGQQLAATPLVVSIPHLVLCLPGSVQRQASHPTVQFSLLCEQAATSLAVTRWRVCVLATQSHQMCVLCTRDCV